MSIISKALITTLDRSPAAPFLFVGSGFSRRYIGLEDWSGLLRRFCAPIKDFGYYLASADGNLPKAATRISLDYNDWWWGSEETAESRTNFAEEVTRQSDALKFEISRYLISKSLDADHVKAAQEEIQLLAKVNVDGIITTNWDLLIEEIFPDYKVFIGQEELLFSNPQSIGEIYKIHGCVTQPTTLVLTDEDYQAFTEKNPYLAAKLVTIFVEHPIIFLGYSLNDPHIKSIIMSIAKCLTQDRIAEFERNLFFVQRAKEGEPESVERMTMQSEDLAITMTVVRTNNFCDVYEPLSQMRRKIPARLLRFFKEQFYELTRSPANLEKKLAVVGYDEIDAAESVEFVVGIGVAEKIEEFDEKLEQKVQAALAKKGYTGVEAHEVFEDCIAETSKFAASDLLESAYPGYSRGNRVFIPVFRYLNAAGIKSQGDLDASRYEGAKKVVSKLNKADYSLPSYTKRAKSFANMSSSEIIEQASSRTEALIMLGFQEMDKFDCDVVLKFLRDFGHEFDSEPYRTSYRKLICKYDRKKYGF